MNGAKGSSEGQTIRGTGRPKPTPKVHEHHAMSIIQETISKNGIKEGGIFDNDVVMGS